MAAVTVDVEGHVAPGFEAVRDAFASNFSAAAWDSFPG
jgi:hypothetical protein